MHGEIGLAVEHRPFELLDEQRLAAKPRQGAMQHAVAGGREAEDLDFQPGMNALQCGFDVVRLPHRQRTVAACDSQDRLGHGRMARTESAAIVRSSASSCPQDMGCAPREP